MIKVSASLSTIKIETDDEILLSKIREAAEEQARFTVNHGEYEKGKAYCDFILSFDKATEAVSDLPEI